ncbi:MAG TPA: NUDIX domain-containing protein [Chitinivibrionales bacterium]|jgi:ADP-ribose pyrophosphatase YjhB (NUDIX family)/ribosomal protein S27AE|nr:NUDIX domain-containing protein [Chitinivibrionales bacterium]
MLTHTRFAYCPRCGKHGVAAKGGNAMRCGRCGYVYFHNCASCTAAIIAVSGGIVLTVRRHAPKKGMLDLPGGFCNYGESLEDTLVREVKEEINLDIADIAYFGSFPNTYRYRGVTYFTTDAVFTCATPDLSAATSNDEIAGIRVIKPGAVDLAAVAFSSTRAALSRYRSRRGNRARQR